MVGCVAGRTDSVNDVHALKHLAKDDLHSDLASGRRAVCQILTCLPSNQPVATVVMNYVQQVRLGELCSNTRGLRIESLQFGRP